MDRSLLESTQPQSSSMLPCHTNGRDSNLWYEYPHKVRTGLALSCPLYSLFHASGNGSMNIKEP